MTSFMRLTKAFLTNCWYSNGPKQVVIISGTSRVSPTQFCDRFYKNLFRIMDDGIDRKRKRTKISS